MINYFTMGISSDLEKMIKFIVETTINYKNINNTVIEKEKKAVLNELLTSSNNSLKGFRSYLKVQQTSIEDTHF